MKLQKHHIVPDYKCKELGLTTSYKVDGVEFYFKENIVRITRLQHADIHWGYWLKDLSALLKVCSPPQWVIDMIPLGDKRDLSSAKLLAEGEIDGIDVSGENHPMFGKTHAELGTKWPDRHGKNNPNYKHGNAVGCYSPDKEVRDQANKKYRSTPEGKESNRKKDAKYYAKNKDKILAQQKEYRAKNKDKIVAQKRAKRQREKQERLQGVGTLVPHM